jgi:hypothetical protein
MAGKRKARRSILRWVPLILVPLVCLAVLAFVLQSPATAEDESHDKTIKFVHSAHVAAGAQCLFCHPGGYLGWVAGIPSSQKCVGCHQNVEVRSESGQAEIEKLMHAWEKGEPLIWPNIVDMPDFVHFEHFPHIAAGKNCEQCHGNVAEMAMAVPAYRINMGFCLNSCHRHQDPVRRERLMTCVTCHK